MLTLPFSDSYAQGSSDIVPYRPLDITPSQSTQLQLWETPSRSTNENIQQMILSQPITLPQQVFPTLPSQMPFQQPSTLDAATDKQPTLIHNLWDRYNKWISTSSTVKQKPSIDQSMSELAPQNIKQLQEKISPSINFDYSNKSRDLRRVPKSSRIYNQMANDQQRWCLCPKRNSKKGIYRKPTKKRKSTKRKN